MDSPSLDTGRTGSAADGRGLRAWLVRHDPGLRATKRSVRAAVLVPTAFALARYGTHNSQTPLFAVFGSVSLLLFVDFGGPLRIRTRSFLVLWVAGAAFIVVGTLCSTHPVVAVASMAVVGFGVLFAGVVSPQAVAASTAALLFFVLPVSEQAPASAIGDRLLGWVLAGVLCIRAAHDADGLLLGHAQAERVGIRGGATGQQAGEHGGDQDDFQLHGWPKIRVGCQSPHTNVRIPAFRETVET